MVFGLLIKRNEITQQPETVTHIVTFQFYYLATPKNWKDSPLIVELRETAVALTLTMQVWSWMK